MRVCVSFAAARPDVIDERRALRLGRNEPHWSPGQYFCLILATVCLGLYGYVYLERMMYQSYESWSFDRAPARAASAAVHYHEGTVVGDIVLGPQGSLPPPESPSPASVIGRLTVPRLHLSAMVREGVDGRTLQLAVGHIPSTVLPGQAGNVGVAGHRDTFFRGLKDLRNADQIEFSTPTGNFSYEVESLMVVEPDNVEVLAASSTNTLTMVTCYPFSYIGNAPKRFIVKAKQVQTPSLAAVEGTAELEK